MIPVGGHDGIVEWLRRDQVVRDMVAELLEDLAPETVLGWLASSDGRPLRGFAHRCTVRYCSRGGRLRPLPPGAVARAVLAEVRNGAASAPTATMLEEDGDRLAMAGRP